MYISIRHLSSDLLVTRSRERIARDGDPDGHGHEGRSRTNTRSGGRVYEKRYSVPGP